MGNCNDGKCFEANILIFLKKILASINDGSTEPINTKDIEIQVVKDSEDVMWLEVRNFDTETGTHTISYFRPGENIHGNPTFPITYPELDITPIINAISAVNDNVEEANQYLDQIKYNTGQTSSKLDQTNSFLSQIDLGIDLLNDLFNNASIAIAFSMESITTPGTTTLSGFRSGSILFEGSGGKINGIEVSNGYVLDISAGDLSEIVSGIILTTPTTADPDNPLSPRILITKLM